MITNGRPVFDVLKLKRSAAFKATRQNHLRCKENYRDISGSNLLRGSAPHRSIAVRHASPEYQDGGIAPNGNVCLLPANQRKPDPTRGKATLRCDLVCAVFR